MSLNLDPIEKPWTLEAEELLRRLNVSKDTGLSVSDALLRRPPTQTKKAKGPVRLILEILFRQTKNSFFFILLVSFIFSLFQGDKLDSLAILSILLLNLFAGLIQEYKAENALEALAQISKPLGRVLREGIIQKIGADEVVPGDILVFEAGDFVLADARIFEAHQLEADEAILTGESLPVAKSDNVLPSQTALADRTNLIFAGTAIARGSGRAVVVAVGTGTEIGKIGLLLTEAIPSKTPLELKIDQLTRVILISGLIVLVIMMGIGLSRGQPLSEVMMLGLSLGLAVLPEGLPTALTLALVLAVRRISKQKAIVRRLDAIEALGMVDVICTDKTGTLTTGEMRVESTFILDPTHESHLLQNMVLCNNAGLSPETGDVTEVALLKYVHEKGKSIEAMRRGNARAFEWAFDSDRKLMSVATPVVDGYLIYVKGAPEVLLSTCELGPDLVKVKDKATEYSGRGMRVLAFGQKLLRTDHLETLSLTQVESELQFTGLVAISDPPKEESREAIRSCHELGIEVTMMTGDHPVTARAIAQDLGLLRHKEEEVLTGQEMEMLNESDLVSKLPRLRVFARVSPEQKLRLVKLLKGQGHVVAMTGDGVNDAPALKQASVGLSMGEGGTEVARQASSIILTDDNFATIVAAVKEGRIVHKNIKTTLQYLFSTNIAELSSILLTVLLGMPVPLLPIHLLWINLVTDGLPSLALSVDRDGSGVQRAQSSELFDRRFLIEMLFIGSCITALSVFLFSQELASVGGLPRARSLVFTFLVFSVLLRALTCRSEEKTILELRPNWLLIGSIMVPVILQLIILRSEIFQDAFEITSLSWRELGILFSLAAIPSISIELFKVLFRKPSRVQDP